VPQFTDPPFFLNKAPLGHKRIEAYHGSTDDKRRLDQILARDPGTQRVTQTFPCSGKQVHNQNHSRPQKVKLELELTEEKLNKFEKLKALKSPQVKNLSELVNLLVDRELERYNRTSKLGSNSKNPRQIKISLKNHLLQKANYKCQHPGCEQTHFLQVDHIKSISSQGTNQPENLQILCQAHKLFKYRSPRPK
jgi:hypothetical protein